MAESEWTVRPDDLRILRRLAERHAEIACAPGNADRRRRWQTHNDLQGGGPMVLAEIGGLLQSGEWSLEPELRCREEWARGVERQLRWTIYHYETIRDDAVVEPWFNVGWRVNAGGYGVDIPRSHGGDAQHMGSYRWEPPITDLTRDFDRLRPRTFEVDRESTLAWKRHLEEALGGVLPVRLRGGFWWTVGLTWTAIDLIGLDGLMLAMHDDPAGLHRLMAFLRDDMLAFMEWAEREGLLTLNNENDYIGSGSQGHTHSLPQPDWQAGHTVRLRDLWGLVESQETVGVSPRMFAEFIFPYQAACAERFGLTYYGCCEPVHNRWHVVKRLANLRKVSVSPWCDERFMSEALGRDYVYCRKPNPALVSTPGFDEDAIREDLRRTLDAAAGCHLELAMKDVHTVCGDMGRLTRWVEMAREEIDRRA